MHEIIVNKHKQGFYERWKLGSKITFEDINESNSRLVWTCYFKSIHSKIPIKITSDNKDFIFFKKGKYNNRPVLYVYTNSELSGYIYIDTKHKIIEAELNDFKFNEILSVNLKLKEIIYCSRFTINLTTSNRRFGLLDIECLEASDEKLVVIISSFFYCRHVWES